MSSLARRWVLLGALLLLPVQLAIIAVFGVEPYPAITQPGFSGKGPFRDGVVRSNILTITATLADGSAAHVPAGDLLPNANGMVVDTILRATLLDESLANRADSVSWLRERMLHLFPETEVTSITFEYARFTSELGTYQQFTLESVRGSVTVDLTQEHS